MMRMETLNYDSEVHIFYKIVTYLMKDKRNLLQFTMK